MRPTWYVLALPLLLTGCEVPKLGKRGASCRASSDCEGTLQCVRTTCLDEAALTEQQVAREREAQRDAQLGALGAELKALQDEQRRLQAQRKELEARLEAVKGESEAERVDPVAPASASHPRPPRRAAKGSDPLGLKDPFTKP